MYTQKTLVDLLLETLKNRRPNLIQASPENVTRVSYEQFWDGVRLAQRWFKEFKVKKGDFIGIISNTRQEWLSVDVAAILSGVITVPVYPTLKASDVQAVLSQVDAKLVFVENVEQEEKMITLGLPTVSFENAEIKGRSFTQISPDRDLVVEKVKPEDTVTIVFTSGTEGIPKGVVQSHKNHSTNLVQVSSVNLFSQDDRVMLFLPLAHSFGRLCGYVAVCLGIETALPEPVSKTSSKLDLVRIVQTFPQVAPTIVPSVPRLFEQMRFEIEKKLGFFSKLINVPVLSTFIRHTVGRSVKRRLFGDRLKYCISGGAKLNPDTNNFFERLGIVILEGYGLTETVVATHVNLPGCRKIGSVGRPLPGVSQRIVDDEIQLRGDNVFSGYFRREEHPFTEDGWFKTGDVGRIDEDGFLYVTGRKKEILVLSSGKNVPALKVENTLLRIFQAKAVVCLGDSRDYVVAVAFVGDEILSVDQIQKKLMEANNILNPFERVKGLVVATGEPTISNGLLTPTLKVKRAEVYTRFKDQVEQLWEKPGQIKIVESW